MQDTIYTLPSTLQAAIFCFAVLTLAAAYSDYKELTIPNRYCQAIVALYPIYVLQSHEAVDWLVALAIAGGLLALGIALFARGLIGAGDAKLAAAVGLWAGPEHFVPYAAFSGLAGGGLALFLWLHHRMERAPSPSMLFITEADPDFLERPMPYGVAIAVGGLYVAFTLIS